MKLKANFISSPDYASLKLELKFLLSHIPELRRENNIYLCIDKTIHYANNKRKNKHRFTYRTTFA